MKIHKFTEITRQIWTVGFETLICWWESPKQGKILMLRQEDVKVK